MNIGVAIVTFNSSRDIAKCIESVRREGIQDIAVIDSVSTDSTAYELSKLKCNYRVLDINKGFGYAANCAVRMLNTEYVLFLNPDSEVNKGAIPLLVQTLGLYPKAGIIGMLLCDFTGNPEGMAHGNEPNIITMIARKIFRKKMPSKPFPTDWVSGGAFLMKRSLFEEVDGFDEGFFLYWEDIDLCRRIRDKGYGVMMDPRARVKHIRGGSNLGNAEKTAIYDQSADRYYKKHYSTPIWHIQRLLRRWYRVYYSLPS